MNDELQRTLIEVITPKTDELHSDETVECERLFDAEYWESLDPGTQRAMGRYIAALVRAKAVPLERAGFHPSTRHNLYRKI